MKVQQLDKSRREKKTDSIGGRPRLSRLVLCSKAVKNQQSFTPGEPPL